ncbi:hypothetical protein [Streptomyces sp. PTD5-9]|uniref:hypothetical protein n=1 Tax=Streptomyces sp. PTD5-9 TaxID=3120150 RepID=UPI003008EBB1
MRPAFARRTLRLTACAAAAAGLLSVGLAMPASADEPVDQTDQLWIDAPGGQNLPLGGGPDGEPQSRTLAIGLYHDNGNFTVTGGLLTVDVSGIAGVAEVTWPDNCAPSGTTAVCSVPDVPIINDDYSRQVRLTVRAADGAAAGAHGRITYAAVATGGPAGSLEAPRDSFDSTLTVAGGPDLSLENVAPVKDAQPGSTHTVPFTLTNKGDAPSEGFTVRMVASYGLDLVTRYPECTYRTLGDGGYAPMTEATCAFDQVLEPGDSFALPEPMRVTLAPHAYAERLDMSVDPGNGAADLADEDNYTIAYLDAVNTADFEVRGVRVAGAAGETVTAELGFRNNGPAWLGNLGSGDPVAKVDFTVPEGVTVTSAPEECIARSLDGVDSWPSSAGAPRYVCKLPYWTLPDTAHTLAFKLRIDQVVPDATGQIVLRPSFGSAPFPFDPNPDNNTAQFVVNPASGV